MDNFTEKFDIAENLYHSGDFNSALTLFEDLWKESGNGEAALMFANSLKCLGRYDDAERIYNYLIGIDPTWEAPLYNLAGIYYKRGEYEKAKELFRKATVADSTSADAWFKLGDCCRMLDADNIDEAMKYYHKCIAITEDNNYLDEAYFYLGIGYLKQEEADLAYECLNKANALYPNNAETLHFLGLCREHQNEPDEAMEYYEKALAIEDRCDTHINLALCYNDKDDTEKAITHAQTAYELHPDSDDALFYYCQLLGSSGQTKEAYSQLLSSELSFDDKENLLELLLLLALEQKDSSVADLAYEKLKALSPDCDTVLYYEKLKNRHTK